MEIRGKFNDKEIIGKRFNKLIVLSCEKQERRWNCVCRCDCGEVFTTQKRYILNGHTKSCGCLRKEQMENRKWHSEIAKKHFIIDMIGKKYGSWTVVSENGRSKSCEVLYLCRCDCGTEKTLLGRLLRTNITKSHCGCKDKPKIKKEKTIKKQIDRREFAKDAYCIIQAEGVSLKEFARDNGYKTSCWLSTLFCEHIEGYREESAKRKEESSFKKYERSLNKWSKKYLTEKDFQEDCCRILKERGVCYKEYEYEMTGFEIDIVDNEHCYELKNRTRLKDIYCALGQLIINSQISGLKPILLIPSDCQLPDKIISVLKYNEIDVLTEREL